MKWHQITSSAVCLILFVFNATATVRYVDLNCTNATPPYTDWSIAATNIQDAINSAGSGDLVLVTNGIYRSGNQFFVDLSNPIVNGNFISSRFISSRIEIPSGVTVSSVNGPAVTMIEGTSRSCAALIGNSALSGFTLTNGNAGNGYLGGGAYCQTTNALISNCIICSNTASAGAGVYLGTLTNCILSKNVATYDGGGGAYGSVMNNCTLIGNTASAGGGAFGSVLNNCLVISNRAVLSGIGAGGAGYSNVMNNCLILHNEGHVGRATVAVASALTNCTICYNHDNYGEAEIVVVGCILRNCILLQPSFAGPFYNGNDLKNCCVEPKASLVAGNGNIKISPLFVNTNSDFHLQSNSPCINSGNNAFVAVTNDFDGNPRIVAGTVDMGAYEFQSPASIISYAYLQQYGLPTDGSADDLDSDGDSLNNWKEWKAGTNPTNAASVLQLASPSNTVSGVTVTWQSVSGVTYYLQSGTNLSVQPAFSSIQSNLVGQAGTTSYTDTTATTGGPYFYRVGVQ